MLNHSIKNFELKIIDQNWLGNEPQQFDLCSHGHLLLVIAGQTILDGREESGLSESALALLRTLDHDHNSSSPVAEKLIFHGCGTELMRGCPIGVDWDVRHHQNLVSISKIRRWDWPDEARPTLFSDLEIDLEEADYRQAIVSFASQVKSFFVDQEKIFYDQNDHLAFEKFWMEFDQRLSVHLNLLQSSQ